MGTADLVIFGALLDQQLPHVPDWTRTARRLVDIYLVGMAGPVECAADM